MDQPKIMTDKEAAKFLGIGLSTLRNWRCQCKGPVYLRMGRAIRYCLADLEKFIESSRIMRRQ